MLNKMDNIIVVVAFIIFIIVLIKHGETRILNKVLFNLVTQAEKQFGGGTGELKFAAVDDWIYQRIPTILKFLFTAKDIQKMIEDVLEVAKKKWNMNDNIKLYIETGEPIEILAYTETTPKESAK